MTAKPKTEMSLERMQRSWKLALEVGPCYAHLAAMFSREPKTGRPATTYKALYEEMAMMAVGDVLRWRTPSEPWRVQSAALHFARTRGLKVITTVREPGLLTITRLSEEAR